MAWTNVARILIITGFLGYFTPGLSMPNISLSSGSSNGTGVPDTSRNKTCGEIYKDCLNGIDFDGPYAEACYQTLLCSSTYFECRGENNSTAIEDPLEYPSPPYLLSVSNNF